MTFIIAKKWNYYNDIDENVASLAKELIRRGLVPDGEVDTRSILDVEPADLRSFAQCHFFFGILGWPYALRLAGWADDRSVWTGSLPCQPFSAAGRGLGRDDERHLAPHWASLVAECQPPVVFGEQVASAAVFGKATGRARVSIEGASPLEWAWLDDLFDRLEAAHYACGASDIPAAGVGAAHIRQRTFFGARRLVHPDCAGQQAERPSPVGFRPEHEIVIRGAIGGLADADDARSQGRPGVPECADQRTAGPGGLEGGLEHPQSNGRVERGSEPSGRGAASGRGDSWVADSNGGDARAEWEQRGGQQRQQPQDGGIVGLADASGSGRQQLTVFAGSDGAGGGAGQEGLEPRPDAPDSPWGVADWLFCRDGKWRPVESGTFPLAHGVSARVGRLRGYGNAIVPQAAAEFIRAFDEVTR